jgi:hypothetical protein
MNLLRRYALHLCAVIFISAVLTAPVAGQTTLDQDTATCEAAFNNKNWADVVDTCGHVVSINLGILSHRNSYPLSDADALETSESLIFLTVKVAYAYEQLGNLDKARGEIKLARDELAVATAEGLSPESAEYKKLEALIDNPR